MTDRHPDRKALERFLDGGLPQGQSRVLQRHLFLCPVCEERLLALLPGSLPSPHPLLPPAESYRGLVRASPATITIPRWPRATISSRRERRAAFRTLAGDRAPRPRAAAVDDRGEPPLSELGALRAPPGPLAPGPVRGPAPGGRPPAAGAGRGRAVEPRRVWAGIERGGQGPGVDLAGERPAPPRRLPAGRAGLPDGGAVPLPELARSPRRGPAPGAQGSPAPRPAPLRRGSGAARGRDRHLSRGQRAPPPGPGADGQGARAAVQGGFRRPPRTASAPASACSTAPASPGSW